MMTEEDLKNVACEFAKMAYKVGYEHGDSNQAENSVYQYEEGIEDGLKQAWEVALRLITMPIEYWKHIFPNSDCVKVMTEYSAPEVMAKINDYEEKKREEDNKIKIIKSNLRPLVNTYDKEIICKALKQMEVSE